MNFSELAISGPIATPADAGWDEARSAWNLVAALSKLDAGFVMLGIGMPMTPELGTAIDAHLTRLQEAMSPWAADGGYFNFAEAL